MLGIIVSSIDAMIRSRSYTFAYIHTYQQFFSDNVAHRISSPRLLPGDHISGSTYRESACRTSSLLVLLVSSFIVRSISTNTSSKRTSCCKSYEIAEKSMEIWPVVRLFQAMDGRMHGIVDAVLWSIPSFSRVKENSPQGGWTRAAIIKRPHYSLH